MVADAPVHYLIHTPGCADLGVEPRSPDQECLLYSLATATDPERITALLRLRLPEQKAGTEAPIAAALDLTSQEETPPNTCLVMVAVGNVRKIAQAIERALALAPSAYGSAFAEIAIVSAEYLTEKEVANAVREFLGKRVRPGLDRVTMTWGSGSTQVAFGALDAIIEHGAPWALIATHPTTAARHAVFDPVTDLPVDPLVPLLRRWRYYDLVARLARGGLIRVTESQHRVIRYEAEQLGRAYLEPTAAGLRTIMAAALMRNDASSGFAVRAYVEARYQELRADRGNVDRDLLEWAASKVHSGYPTLGHLIRLICEETTDPDIVASKSSPSGLFLLSGVVKELNKMGRNSAHELRPTDEANLKELRSHLAALDQSEADTAEAAGLSPLSLVPGRRVWYVAILPLPSDKGDPIIQQVVTAASDPHVAASVDSPVRSYLGVPEGQLLPLGILIFGTSRTAEAARELAADLRSTNRPSTSVVIDDSFVEGSAREHRGDWMRRTLHAHLSDDAAAVVLIPSGPKEHVLSLLHAAQRVAATRGIPLYLRQLVDKQQSVIGAGMHRMPLRFGADLALLTAALHALDCGELDTAGRLLSAAGTGQRLSAKVMSLSHALRCDRSRLREWPAEVVVGCHEDELTKPMIAERIEVWASLPYLSSDVATQMRAIVGACASIEVSTKRHERHQLRKETFPELYAVRDCLPITHGGVLPAGGVASLVRDASNRGFHTAGELLTGMAERARTAFPSRTPAAVRKRLCELVADIRVELTQLRDAARRSRVPRQMSG